MADLEQSEKEVLYYHSKFVPLNTNIPNMLPYLVSALNWHLSIWYGEDSPLVCFMKRKWKGKAASLVAVSFAVFVTSVSLLRHNMHAINHVTQWVQRRKTDLHVPPTFQKDHFRPSTSRNDMPCHEVNCKRESVVAHVLFLH